MLTDKQKLASVRFAKAALRREHCSWRRVMIIDSKYFRLHAMGRPAGRWCTPATRAFVAKPKQSIAAHVYIGIPYKGFTSLKFVTGTHKQVSKYIDPKIHPRGQQTVPNAGQWADRWQMQQGNAPAHKTPTDMAYIAANVPGGDFLAWPPNSPDLFPNRETLELDGQ
ncbi:TPA: hypothetical protein ACH3X1_007398 [Trebouxia sp. C0004]